MSLTVATLIPALLRRALGAALLSGRTTVTAGLKAFPRSSSAAVVFFGAGALWFLKEVWHLSPADFEVEEREQSQTVRQVIYVRTADAAAPAASAAIGTSAGPARPSTGSGLPQREQTGRVVAFVVDDLNLSFESIARMRGRGRPILPHPQEARSPLHRHPPL